MTHATTAATTQDALNAILGDVLPAPGLLERRAPLWPTDRTRRLTQSTDGRVEALPTRPRGTRSSCCSAARSDSGRRDRFWLGADLVGGDRLSLRPAGRVLIGAADLEAIATRPRRSRPFAAEPPAHPANPSLVFGSSPAGQPTMYCVISVCLRAQADTRLDEARPVPSACCGARRREPGRAEWATPATSHDTIRWSPTSPVGSVGLRRCVPVPTAIARP